MLPLRVIAFQKRVASNIQKSSITFEHTNLYNSTANQLSLLPFKMYFEREPGCTCSWACPKLPRKHLLFFSAGIYIFRPV